mgnify:CR=1 FL=1
MPGPARHRCGVVLAVCLGWALWGLASVAEGQSEPRPGDDPTAAPAAAAAEDITPSAMTLAIEPVAQDEAIRDRLKSVLDATDWFADPRVRVENGVVFLSGPVKSAELKKWAGDLARNTQGVAAVANQMEVAHASAWDFSAALSGLSGLGQDLAGAMPMVMFGLFILALSGLAAWLSARGARSLLRGRIRARLLRDLLAMSVGVIVLFLGAYIVLRISGLTQLALTLVGGTGLVGLALGIAFRGITENYLASIFLSVQQPFQTGDLVEINGVTGYVKQLNIRTTVLLTLDGNLAQLPNSTVYVSTIRNFTAMPNRREDFTIGIGYEDPIDRAQEVARRVLNDHPAVLKDPEPWVLADSLGSATVNLKVYFWINGRENSWLKVRSSVIRLVKRAFQEQGISMPDEAREVVFPGGVPVTLLRRGSDHGANAPREADASETLAPASFPSASGQPRIAVGSGDASSQAEGGLASESDHLKSQAEKIESQHEAENLLGPRVDEQPGP